MDSSTKEINELTEGEIQWREKEEEKFIISSSNEEYFQGLCLCY